MFDRLLVNSAARMLVVAGSVVALGLFIATPTPRPVVHDGAFLFSPRGGGQITGHVIAAGEATGTSSTPGCGSGTWYACRANR